MEYILRLILFVALLGGVVAQTVDQCANLVNKPLAVQIIPGIPTVTVGLISECLNDSVCGSILHSI